ncbi:hypothetical protein [Streptacidiphilus rugosus]|uniref:hypothetical protein n=1 Tax=Streptacidiphilus rugosus TaxID=405783 RepID=UPI000563212B|nr:hypothetical protein [Streptacidiphilus rugosus]
MARLSKTLKTSLIAATSSAVLLIAPTSASASDIQYGGNWARQFDTAGQGCYAWTNWTSNTVTAHIYQQSDVEDCYIQIRQYPRGVASYSSSDGLTNSSNQTITVPKLEI